MTKKNYLLVGFTNKKRYLPGKTKKFSYIKVKQSSAEDEYILKTTFSKLLAPKGLGSKFITGRLKKTVKRFLSYNAGK